MNGTLLIPCAGRSSRFSGERPKYLRTCPNGNLMLIETLSHLKLNNYNKIIITVAKQHIVETMIDLKSIENEIYKIHNILPIFTILDNFTNSQSETVYETLIKNNIDGYFAVKDCDCFYSIDIPIGNVICTSKLDGNINSINKSYIKTNKLGFVSNIVEKMVIGDTFCCGLYCFESSKLFIDTFLYIKNLNSINNNELYISHIIQKMLLDNFKFTIKNVDNYCDVGTIEDWGRYTSQYSTIFCDIDGVLVENGSQFFEPKWGYSAGLQNNINIINNLYDNGKTTIILTTSRKDTYKNITIEQLKKLNIKYHNIIFNLPHCKRILINDFSNSNEYPTAVSINIKRNSDLLKDFI